MSCLKITSPLFDLDDKNYKEYLKRYPSRWLDLNGRTVEENAKRLCAETILICSKCGKSTFPYIITQLRSGIGLPEFKGQYSWLRLPKHCPHCQAKMTNGTDYFELPDEN